MFVLPSLCIIPTLASLTMAPKSRFASRGAFDALAAEDSDAEQDQKQDMSEDLVTPEPVASEGTPSRNTRSARRSAKRNTGRGSETPTNERGTDSEADLEVMTTRSGSRIRQPSVPIVKEENPSNDTISATAASEQVARPQSKEEGTSEPAFTQPQPAKVSKAAPQLSSSQSLSAEKQNEEEREARKVYWKKVYERTLFTFIMIGGFVGASYGVLQARERQRWADLLLFPKRSPAPAGPSLHDHARPPRSGACIP